jgi:tetratricopeptide (TPR) repeat protein
MSLPRIPRWIAPVALIAAVICAQFLILKAFRQQQSRYLVQKSTAAMNRPGYMAEAQQIAQRAVELNPQDGYAWFNLGTSVYLQQQWTQAIDILQEGIKLLPHSYNATRLLAFSFYNTGNFSEASSHFSEYLAMIPNPPVSPELVFGRAGLAALRTGQLDDASYNLVRATPLEEKKSDNLRARTLAAVLGNRLGGAHYCATLFRFYAPQEELNPFELVANAMRGGKISQATQFLERILPESGDDLSVVKGLAAAYSASGQAAKAEELIAQQVSARPDSPSLRLVYGDILFAQKRYAEASVQYDEHLRLQPDSPLRQDIEEKKKQMTAGR